MLDIDRVSDPYPPTMGKVSRVLCQLDDEGEPIVITINGKAEIAVSDDDSFRMLAALIDRLELLEALKEATRSLDEGKGLSLEEVKEQARVKYGYSL